MFQRFLDEDPRGERDIESSNDPSTLESAAPLGSYSQESIDRRALFSPGHLRNLYDVDALGAGAVLG
jgi:hypothetical protein